MHCKSTVAGYDVDIDWVCDGGSLVDNALTLPLDQDVTCYITNKQMALGCTSTCGFWKQQHTYLMEFPVYLGTVGGQKTITVSSIPQAVSILTRINAMVRPMVLLAWMHNCSLPSSPTLGQMT